MIETAAALKDIQRLAAVPEISGLYVGPVDLALAVGVAPSLRDATFRSALQQVIDTAHANQLQAGMFAVDGGSAAELADFGFDQVVVSSDVAQLRAALTTELNRARGAV
jgi:2-keto-3-deoxy-L-rhamnonate aldolase RhmA